MEMMFWRPEMLQSGIGIRSKLLFDKSEVFGKSSYNGHLSAFSRRVIFIPEALTHNPIDAETSP